MEDVAASTLLSWITHSRGGWLPYCEDIQEALRRGPPDKVPASSQHQLASSVSEPSWQGIPQSQSSLQMRLQPQLH